MSGAAIVGVSESDLGITDKSSLELLAQGPNSVDSKRGIQTDLGAAPHFDVQVAHKVAQVTLDVSTFGDLFGSNLYVPLAQIVFTLMEDFPSLTGVNFYLAGELFNYTPSGTASHAPVTERTYAVLAPQPSQSKPSS